MSKMVAGCVWVLGLAFGAGACSRSQPGSAQTDASTLPSAPAPTISVAATQESASPVPSPSQWIPADAGEDDGPYLSGRTWITCLDGFRVESKPELDLLRLGMLCGPYHGLRKLGEPVTGSLRAGEAKRHTFEAKRGQCFRIFAVGERKLSRMALRASGPSSAKLAETVSDRPWAALGKDGAFCVDQAGVVSAELEAIEGQGAFAMQVWLLP